MNPDSSTAQRSTTTGHLLITMPKSKAAVFKTQEKLQLTNQYDRKSKKSSVEKLEVDPSTYSMPDIGTIVKDEPSVPLLGSSLGLKAELKPRENSPDFIDNPDVPPLL